MTSTSPFNASQAGQRALGDYVAILRRRYKVILFTTIGVAAIALVISIQQAKVYEATANVLLSRRDLGAELTGVANPDLSGDPSRFAQTAAELARSSQVASLATQLAGVPGISPAAFLEAAAATPRLNADVLQFSVKNADPRVATVLVNGYANAFSQYKLKLDTSTISDARAELTAKIAGIRESGDRSSDLYKNLVENEQQLRTMQLLQSRDIVLQATQNGVQVAPTPKRTTFFAAILGFVVGLALAFLWEALDGRIRSAKQIEHVLELPLLGRLPEPARQLRAKNRLSLIDDPASGYAEAIRMLRSNIEVAGAEAEAHVIMITSYGQREGKSTTIANLAVAFARAGKSVALVDLDLRQPIISKFFDLDDGVGITDVALDGVPLKQAMRSVSVAGAPNSGAGRPAPGQSRRLTVLPVGRMSDSPWDLASSDAFGSALAQLRSDFDFVLVDAPPMGVVSDAKTIAPYVDALLVVAREGMVERADLENLVRELELIATPSLGFVLTGVDIQEVYEARSGGSAARPPEPGDVTPVGQLNTRRSARKTPWVASARPKDQSRDVD